MVKTLESICYGGHHTKLHIEFLFRKLRPCWSWAWARRNLDIWEQIRLYSRHPLQLPERIWVSVELSGNKVKSHLRRHSGEFYVVSQWTTHRFPKNNQLLNISKLTQRNLSLHLIPKSLRNTTVANHSIGNGLSHRIVRTLLRLGFLAPEQVSRLSTKSNLLTINVVWHHIECAYQFMWFCIPNANFWVDTKGCCDEIRINLQTSQFRITSIHVDFS